MNEPLRLADTIVPKSDQLNADDLLTGPITVTIAGVRRGDKEQPVAVDIVGQRPFKPCKSMRRVLISAWGDDGKVWIGRSMTLYCDPDVMFGGVKVGGIRISHLSDIDGPLHLNLTATRGKKTPYTVRPLPRAVTRPTAPLSVYPADRFEQNLPSWLGVIAAGRYTADALIARIEQEGAISEEQKKRLREPQQAATAAPTFSALQIETDLLAAPTLDALDTAASFIAELPSQAEREDLSRIYDQRRAALMQ